MRGQVVDTPSAQEFMAEILRRAPEQELAVVAGELETKSAGMRALLGSPEPVAGPEDLRRVLRSVFATRRRADAVIGSVGPERLAAEVARLLHGSDDLPARFARFLEPLESFPGVGCDLASELLHLTFPDRYWLWTRWVWDPRTETGALPLVTMEEVDLAAASPAETYLRVGEAVAFLDETGKAAGFTAMGRDLFGLDVFLACVYAVYMYTVLRLRMTQEFNRIVPELPALVRRLLGTHRLEV